MGCCVTREEQVKYTLKQFNLNMTPKNKNRSSIINTQNLTPTKAKNIQLTVTNIDKEDLGPNSIRICVPDNELSKNNKSSFFSNYYNNEQPSTYREPQTSILDKSDLCKRYSLKNLNYGANTHHDVGIFQDLLMNSNKNIFPSNVSIQNNIIFNDISSNAPKEFFVGSMKDEGKISVVQPSYFKNKVIDNEK